MLSQPSRESECGGPQRQHVPGIKPCDLHEIALYLCGARTKREAERGSFFSSGEENWREEGENGVFSIPQKGGRGRGARGSDISLVVSQTQSCRMAGTLSPRRLTPCAIMQPNVFIRQVSAACDASPNCMYECSGDTLRAQLYSSSSHSATGL